MQQNIIEAERKGHATDLIMSTTFFWLGSTEASTTRSERIKCSRQSGYEDLECGNLGNDNLNFDLKTAHQF